MAESGLQSSCRGYPISSGIFNSLENGFDRKGENPLFLGQKDQQLLPRESSRQRPPSALSCCLNVLTVQEGKLKIKSCVLLQVVPRLGGSHHRGGQGHWRPLWPSVGECLDVIEPHSHSDCEVW